MCRVRAAPSKGREACIANPKQFSRETKISKALEDGNCGYAQYYVPPRILGIQGMKKACKKYKIRHSASTRSMMVAQMMTAQPRELREQEKEEDEEGPLSDSP